MENQSLLGCLLVCACHTDLGCESEAAAGYYNRPWRWDRIVANAGSIGIIQCHSSDDPFIPMTEASYVAQQLSSEFHQFDNRSHFFCDEDIDSMLDILIDKIRNL